MTAVRARPRGRGGGVRDRSGGQGNRGIVEGESIPQVFIPQLVELWRTGRFPVDRRVSTFAFADINDAVAAMESGQVLKPVIRFD